jgi:hypothetical protein
MKPNANIYSDEKQLLHDELLIRKTLNECLRERLLNNTLIIKRLEEELK